MCPKGVYPLKWLFTIFGFREEIPGPHSHTKFHCSGLKKCGPTASKIAKDRNFWYKSGSPHQKKWNIGAQLQTFVYAMTPTALKITLLHSVSVITNFVIPKAWQTDRQKNRTFWSTAGARPTSPTILGMVIEEVRPIFAPPNYFWSYP